MSRTFRHLGEDWEAHGAAGLAGSGIASGVVIAEASNWGVTFRCVSNPAKGSFLGSLYSKLVLDVQQVPEADLRESLDTAVAEAKGKLTAALEDRKWDWRTVEGLAKGTGFSSEQVSYLLNSDPDTFIRSRVPDKNGRPLYSTRDHYAQNRGLLDLLRST